MVGLGLLFAAASTGGDDTGDFNLVGFPDGEVL
jgi:hypothetical protein